MAEITGSAARDTSLPGLPRRRKLLLSQPSARQWRHRGSGTKLRNATSFISATRTLPVTISHNHHVWELVSESGWTKGGQAPSDVSVDLGQCIAVCTAPFAAFDRAIRKDGMRRLNRAILAGLFLSTTEPMLARARQFGRRCAVPKAKFKGVELVRSPMRADDSSARLISMSLKTSKYSLGAALCCCRVQPVPQTRSFPRPSRFDRTTILRCREGCCAGSIGPPTPRRSGLVPGRSRSTSRIPR